MVVGVAMNHTMVQYMRSTYLQLANELGAVRVKAGLQRDSSFNAKSRYGGLSKG